MFGHRTQLTIGLMIGLIMTGSALAVPEVVTLGSGSASDDPIAACGDQAASPWEDGHRQTGLEDKQISIDAAMAACEAAHEVDPQSAQVQAWLARVYILAGRADEARALLDAASDAGTPLAAYLLSTMLAGDLTPGGMDPERAVALLRQASDAGLAPAQVELAERYEAGNNVETDYSEAERLYQLAADQGLGLAAYKLGTFEHGGYLAEADYRRAMELYQRAADLGEPLGNYGLGRLYEFGQGVDQDYARAAEYYQIGADGGEKMSQTSLAYLYEQGLGLAQDYSRSFALLEQASAQDWGFAHAALSIHYLFGQGTAVDEARAYDLAWRAQRLGVTYAEGILGYMFQYGLGTSRDLSSALQHYQDGANGGDQYSADQIAFVQSEIACEDAAGSPYEPGGVGHGRAFEDIDPDEAIPACEAVTGGQVGNRVWLARAYARAERYEEAVPLLEEGVAAGNVLAHTVLGDMLMAGAGVEQDTDRAISLYRAVADDFGLAQFSLGMAYMEGIGVPQDPAEALRWLRLAESYGVNEAEPEISALVADGGQNQPIDLTGFGREGPAY